MLSRKATGNTALVIATLIASGVVWRLQFRGAVTPPLPKEQHRLVTAAASLHVPERSSNKDFVSSPSSPPRAATPFDGGSVAKGSAAADNFKRPGVAGDPFVVPDSILAACNDPGIKAGHICKGFYADLAQMAKEPRDSAWASDMEEKLQAYVEKEFKDASIRNIDCRTSLCAIEVESTDAKIAALFPYPNPLTYQLIRDSWMESREKTPLGADLNIFVVIYKRK
jgi:hypothetical protein